MPACQACFETCYNLQKKHSLTEIKHKQTLQIVQTTDIITSLFIEHNQCSNASIFALLTYLTVYLVFHTFQMSVEFGEKPQILVLM